MFGIFPVLGWLTVALALVIARATRVSDAARRARTAAGTSLMWLLPPAILSWLLLAVSDGSLMKTHLVLFIAELVLAFVIIPRYRAWVTLPGLFAAICLVWSGGIAVQGVRRAPTRLGPEFRPPMGSTQEGVSASFTRRELALVFARAQQFAPSGALKEFSCGDSLPALPMSVELIPEAEYEERRVTLEYLPDLTKDDNKRCLDRGISYLFQQAVRQVDHGPPVDYGYVNPSTGRPLYSAEWDSTPKPICRCELRGTGREWVAYTEKAAAELR